MYNLRNILPVGIAASILLGIGATLWFRADATASSLAARKITSERATATAAEERVLDPIVPYAPRPFPVAQTNQRFQWTNEDGRLPEVYAHLVNNSDMRQDWDNMASSVLRRQLVYVGPEFTRDIQSAIDGNIKEVTLPGFAGTEIVMSVTKHERDHGGYAATSIPSGVLTGHLKGDPETDVFIAQIDGATSISYWNMKDGTATEYASRLGDELVITQTDRREFAKNFQPCDNATSHK